MLPDKEPVEPTQLDTQLEPILRDACKLVAFEARDKHAVVLSEVVVDVGYVVLGEEGEHHLRITMVISPTNFEDSYMGFATKRLLDDARKIIDGMDNGEGDDEE